MSLFQAVGGMDRIAEAFEMKLAGQIRLGAEWSPFTTWSKA